ncbi:MAG: N-acetylmuramoyl-L-alanine amidase [Thermomicrobiales bacterium]
MSGDPKYPRRRALPDDDKGLPPLPAWNSASPGRTDDTPRQDGSAGRKVPSYAHQRQPYQGPQFETILKALGAVLVITALVVGIFIARPDRGGSPAATATSSAVVVIASDEPPLVSVEGTPQAPAAFDARNANFTICLDPGHGGSDMGHQRSATAAVPAMDESYFNLAIAKELRQRLLERGFDVIMTRADDEEVNAEDFDANNDGKAGISGSSTEDSGNAANLDELQSRIDRCNDGSADVLLSIHVDGSIDPAVRGSLVWFSEERAFRQQNQVLAALIYEELETQMRAVGYPWIGQGVFTTDQVGQDNSHDQQQMLLIDGDRPELKEPSAMPGVVVEVLTLTSDADATFLSGDQGIATIAVALDQAIVRFVETSLRGSG